MSLLPHAGVRIGELNSPSVASRAEAVATQRHGYRGFAICSVVGGYAARFLRLSKEEIARHHDM